MTTETEHLLAEVLRLPADEQEEFFSRLVDTLDPPRGSVDHLDDEQLTDELARRAAEMRADPTAGVPWTQVREMR